MSETRDVEFVFESQEDGGYYAYAPDLPGLHTQGETLEDALTNAKEALTLFIEGLRDDGRPFPDAVIRRHLSVSA